MQEPLTHSQISEALFPNEPLYINPDEEFDAEKKDNIVYLFHLLNQNTIIRKKILKQKEPGLSADELKSLLSLIGHPDLQPLVSQNSTLNLIPKQSFEDALQELNNRYDEYMGKCKFYG